MRSLRYLNVMLTVLAVLLTLQLWTTWTTSPAMSQEVHAQGIPNAGAQRKEMIEHLAKLNQQVGQLNDQLRSGQTRVQVDLPAREEK